MSILDKLKSIFNVDLSGLRKGSLQVNIFSNNKIFVNKDLKTVNLGISALTPEKTKQLKVITRDLVSREGFLAIEEESNNLLTDFQRNDSDLRNKSILEYFRGKIPPQDVEALRASLYLGTVYEKHNSGGLVAKLKNDIIARYGVRGKNIANLCTAGYFETIVKPLYEELSKRDGFTSEQFLTRYEVIVTQYPFAVFVSRATSHSSLKSEVLMKIIRNKKYGIGKLNIHGIGIDNVDKIQKVLQEDEIKKQLTDRPQMDSGRGYVIVTIFY